MSAVPEANPTTAAWLDVLWPAFPEGEWLSIFSIQGDDRRTDWASSPEEAARVISSLSTERNIWLGCATRKERLSKGARGGAADCSHTPGLWTDIDVMGPAHAAQNLPPDRETALDILRRFPLPPTAIVESGNGLQAWWLFNEPVSIAEAGPVLDDWGYTMSALFEEAGYKLDNVFDTPRVLRVPGTLNHKTDPPKPVTVLLSDGPRYGLDDIDQNLTSAPKPPVEDLKAKVPYIGPKRPGDAFNQQVRGEHILAQAGWTHVRTDRNGDQHWKHPASTNSTSATVYIDDGHTTLWTTSIENTPAQRPFDPFGLYTHLFHGGNFRQATEAIVDAGFGVRAVRLEEVKAFYEANGWPTGEQEALPAASEDDPWPDPIPFDEVEVPPFPIETLPAWMSDAAKDVARQIQVPVDLSAMLALGALAITVTGRAMVKVTEGWREGMNLYIAVALPPGAGKSPAFEAMLSEPLGDLEDALEAEGQHRQIRARIGIEDLEAQIKKAQTTEERFLLEVEKAELEGQQQTNRLLAQDVTPEAFVWAMAENGGRLSLASDEGGPIVNLDQYRGAKQAKNLDAMLQAHSGKRVQQDRKTGGSKERKLTIPKAWASMVLTVQPTVLRSLADPELAERGFGARFILSVPKSNIGWRDMRLKSADVAVRRVYYDKLQAIARRFFDETIEVTLSPAAYRRFEEFRTSLEARRRFGRDLDEMLLWSSKLDSFVARIAGLLWLADGGQGQISMPQLDRAIEIGGYLVEHQRRAWGVALAKDDSTGPRRILGWAAEHEHSTFTVRDLIRSNNRVWPDKETVEKHAAVLVARGLAREIEVQKPGPKSKTWAIYPGISAAGGYEAWVREWRLEQERSGTRPTDTEKCPTVPTVISSEKLSGNPEGIPEEHYQTELSELSGVSIRRFEASSSYQDHLGDREADSYSYLDPPDSSDSSADAPEVPDSSSEVPDSSDSSPDDTPWSFK